MSSSVFPSFFWLGGLTSPQVIVLIIVKVIDRSWDFLKSFNVGICPFLGLLVTLFFYWYLEQSGLFFSLLGFFWSIKLTWEKIFWEKRGDPWKQRFMLGGSWFLFWCGFGWKNFFSKWYKFSGWDMSWFFPTKNTVIYSKFLV